MSTGDRLPLLERLGLHRPELRAWALYDWANSVMVTTVVTAVFPIYFARVAAAGLAPPVATQRYAVASTAALVAVAAMSPFLGTLADVRPWKKRFLALFLALGAGATALLVTVGRGDWLLAAALFLVGNVGLNGSFVFYDSLLPHVARDDELDRVSTAGYALGYLGGGLLLAVQLAVLQRPGWFGLPAGPGLTPAQETLPARLVFLSVAVWWVLFSLPLLRRVPEPAVAPPSPGDPGAARLALRRLGQTFGALKAHRQALLMMAAYLVYNDGIGTIIRMATIYGTEIGIGQGSLIAAILMVQFIGIPAAFAFGALAARIGSKRAILLGLAAYGVASVFAYFMRSATDFFLLAVLVALVQGGTQALSRSLFASLVPRHQSGEFFGFFSVVDKVAGIFGPLVFAVASSASGSSRVAVLSVVGFFAVGAALLGLVDVEGGQKLAREADREPASA